MLLINSSPFLEGRWEWVYLQRLDFKLGIRIICGPDMVYPRRCLAWGTPGYHSSSSLLLSPAWCCRWWDAWVWATHQCGGHVRWNVLFSAFSSRCSRFWVPLCSDSGHGREFRPGACNPVFPTAVLHSDNLLLLRSCMAFFLPITCMTFGDPCSRKLVHEPGICPGPGSCFMRNSWALLKVTKVSSCRQQISEN